MEVARMWPRLLPSRVLSLYSILSRSPCYHPHNPDHAKSFYFHLSGPKGSPAKGSHILCVWLESEHHSRELLSTKGSKKLKSSGVSRCPAISTSKDSPVVSLSGTDGTGGRSTKRLPEPSKVTLNWNWVSVEFVMVDTQSPLWISVFCLPSSPTVLQNYAAFPAP